MGMNRRDLACGAAFAGIGAFFAGHAWIRLPIGTAFQMGPGFFPIVLGIALMAFGVAILLRAWGSHIDVPREVPWRAIILVTAAVLIFGVFVRPLGFAPAVALASFTAAMAMRQSTMLSALGLTAALTVFNTAVFVVGLRMPYPLLGPWLGG
jgi:putative tricarboxylic transport membrane protein